MFMHLTNYSPNKTNGSFIEGSSYDSNDYSKRPKWDFNMLRKEYESQGIDYE